MKRIMLMLTVVAVMLTGCVTPPPDLNTNAKKLVAAEIAWQEVAKLALVSKDRLNEDTRKEVKGMLEKSRTALNSAKAALDVGNDLDFSNALSTANSLIRTVRPILESLEETSDGKCIQSYCLA